MWFSRRHFEVCSDLRTLGLDPRFEPGDVVARGFADLGHEEFQVLPGAKLLSLTAGTVSALSAEQSPHLFWIPSVDETVELLEKRGTACIGVRRIDQREWSVEVQCHGDIEAHHDTSLHLALLGALRGVYRRSNEAG